MYQHTLLLLIEVAKSSWPSSSLWTCHTKCVILPLLVVVTQHFISFRHFLEFLCTIRILVYIRMILLGKLEESTNIQQK